MNAETMARALGGASCGTNGWWNCKCPAHDDRTASLGVHDTDDGGVAWKCMAGCSSKDVGAALRAQDLLPERPEKSKRGKAKRGKHTHTYGYRGENGVLLFEVWRYANPKGFAQRRPDPADPSGWKWSLGDVRRVLYRLPELLAADPAQTVFVCEGEKDCDRLAAVGLLATTSPQGAGKWQATDRNALAGRHVVVLPDNDPPGRQHVVAVVHDLTGKAASVRILDLEGLPEKGDVSTWLDQGHTVDELRKLAAVAPLFADDEPGWHKHLNRTATGSARDVMHNAVVILRHDPDLAGRLRWNRFLCAVEGRQLPWRPQSDWLAWTDTDDLLLTAWMQERGVLIKTRNVADAVQAVAMGAQVHPVLDHLGALQWDGWERLDSWLFDYLGVQDDQDDDEDDGERKARHEYHRQVGRKFLISAVARLDQPGCQADHALIFEGDQGIGKSTTAAVLALDPSWFTDDIRDLGTKDSAQDLRGKWIVELAELSALKRSEVERIKGFISRRVDHYRPSYGRRSEDFGRQCVFIGSTNHSTYLNDETGGRRFWPVKVGKIDLGALRLNVEQLWAEAMAAYRAGERWWLDKPTEATAAQEQKARREPDAWEHAILDFVVGKAAVTVPEILEHKIKIPLDRQDQAAWNRVARVLVANGWERKQKRVNGSRAWLYVRVRSQSGDSKGSANARPSNGAYPPKPPETEIHTGDTGDRVVTEKAANMPVSPVSPLSPVGSVRSANGQTANAHFPFAHAKNVGKPLLSGDTGDTPPAEPDEMVTCGICGGPVALGKPGYAYADDHAHAACLPGPEPKDGERGHHH